MTFSNNADNGAKRREAIEDRANDYEAMAILATTLLNLNSRDMTDGLYSNVKAALATVAKRIAKTEEGI